MPPTDTQFKVISAITMKLAQLGHEVTFVDPITEGPLVTTFRFAPRNTTKIAQVASCSQDLALALRVEDILIRRLPGEGVLGISVPNAERKLVLWRNLCQPPDKQMVLPLNFGVDSQGRPYREDLTKLPHLLITGSTDGGKSVLLRGLIASLMLWRDQTEVKFVLSDCKRVEFGHFDGSPQLLFEPSKTMYETWERMDWLIEEIDRRLHILESWQERNIADYNKRNPDGKLPYIVFVIDELFKVLSSGEKHGEGKIGSQKLARIVSESRAAGIHVVAATQRSSIDVITGSIKANFPARLTFRLPSQEDSRTIIRHSGAEHLLARGDMFYRSPNYPAVLRLHSGYASTEDIKQCVAYASQRQAAPAETAAR